MLDSLEAHAVRPQPGAGIDQRRVRFACIDGIEREDLPLACEVWREDVFASRWADAVVLKLATHFMRYICHPNPTLMILREIEGQYRLDRDEVVRGLTLMRNHAAIESFTIEREDVRVATHLSLLQRLRTLEARSRLEDLAGRRVRLRASMATPISGHPTPGTPAAPFTQVCSLINAATGR